MKPLRVRLSRLLYMIAAVLLGYWGYVWVESHRFQEHWSRELDRVPVRPHPAAAAEQRSQPAGQPVRAEAARAQAKTTGVVGKMDVPRLALSVVMVEGTSDEQLRLGAGHIEGTSFPGEPGNVGIAGHRDTFFRKLQHLARGDLIRLHTADGFYTYAVDSILIVNPDRGDLLDPTPRPALTIVTCYPFYYVGHAPKRFVVRAHQANVKNPASSLAADSTGTVTARSLP
jgi:sortase A